MKEQADRTKQTSRRENFNVGLDIDWADLDLFGHVNNVAVFRYIQAARVRFCEHIGFSSLNAADLPRFMVVSANCNFYSPLYFPGKVKILVNTGFARNTSFELSYQIFDNNFNLAASAKDVLVMYDHHKKVKMELNTEIRTKLSQFQIIADNS